MRLCPASRSRSHQLPALHHHRADVRRHTREQDPAAHRHSNGPGQAVPAAATGQDRPPPPNASSRSYVAPRSATHPETSRHSPPFAPARTAAASDLSHPSMPTPAIPASSRQEHNQTMTSESWFAIDSDDSPLRNRKITTVVLANLTDTLLRAAADDRAFGLLGFNALSSNPVACRTSSIADLHHSKAPRRHV